MCGGVWERFVVVLVRRFLFMYFCNEIYKFVVVFFFEFKIMNFF